jgi:hypothetical protein
MTEPIAPADVKCGGESLANARDGLTWEKVSRETFNATIAPWYVKHGWPEAPNFENLPNTSFLIRRAGYPAAMGFVYLTNSPLAIMTWVVTDPQLHARMAARMLKFLVQTAQAELPKIAVKQIMYLAPPKHVKFFEQLGFKQTESRELLFWGTV